MLGIKTNISNIDFSEQLKKNKLLNVPAADNTVRLAPPLIVSYKEIDKSISIIKKSMKELSKWNILLILTILKKQKLMK